MSGVEARRSYRGLFKKLEHYACAMSVHDVSNILCNYQLNFYTVLNVHELNTRNKNQPFIPTANLFSFQKGVTYSGTWILNRFLSNIQHIRNKRVHF